MVGLEARERAIARLVAMGRSYAAIAQDLGITPAGVRRAMMRPQVRAQVRLLVEAADRAFVQSWADAALLRAMQGFSGQNTPKTKKKDRPSAV